MENDFLKVLRYGEVIKLELIADVPRLFDTVAHGERYVPGHVMQPPGGKQYFVAT